MKIDHIGYAVKRLDKAIECFKKIGYVECRKMIDDHDRNIRICFLENDGHVIEVVAPLDKNDGSPVDGILSKNGPIAYHICYRSLQFDEEIERLIQNGYRIVIPPARAVAFGGKRVVFLMDLFIGLIELVEE